MFLRARLWYVPVKVSSSLTLDTVPEIPDLTEEQKMEGRARYLKQKNERAQRKQNENPTDVSFNALEFYPSFFAPIYGANAWLDFLVQL